MFWLAVCAGVILTHLIDRVKHNERVTAERRSNRQIKQSFRKIRKRLKGQPKPKIWN